MRKARDQGSAPGPDAALSCVAPKPAAFRKCQDFRATWRDSPSIMVNGCIGDSTKPCLAQKRLGFVVDRVAQQGAGADDFCSLNRSQHCVLEQATANTAPDPAFVHGKASEDDDR